MLKFNFILNYILLSTSLITCIESNQIIKAFHHISEFEGKIVLYLKNNANIKLLSKKCDLLTNICETVFLLSNCLISPLQETKQMVDKIHKNKHPFYEIFLIKNPSNTKLKIVYDSKYVSKIEPQSFKAISLFKGIAFNIQHKSVKPFIKDQDLPKGQITNYLKPNVILDMGHGGTDFGAIGFNKIAEKDITYSVGMKLKSILEKKGYNVFLTRISDKFVALDKRTSMANFLQGKTVFISLHANFASNQNASGLETYYADSSLLNKHIFLNNNELILPVLNKLKDKQNETFATILHKNLYQKIKSVNPSIVDRKIKKSISQILLGTQMPTALIELGFLSNRKECELLSSAKYQDIIAQGVAIGIDKYFNEH